MFKKQLRSKMIVAPENKRDGKSKTSPYLLRRIYFKKVQLDASEVHGLRY